MKRLEKRVERELIDLLYSIIITYNPSSVTIINLNGGIKVMINKVMSPEYLFPLHSVAIIESPNIIIARTTLIINPYEKGYTIQCLNFDKKVHGLKEKRLLVKRLKK